MKHISTLAAAVAMTSSLKSLSSIWRGGLFVALIAGSVLPAAGWATEDVNSPQPVMTDTGQFQHRNTRAKTWICYAKISLAGTSATYTLPGYSMTGTPAAKRKVKCKEYIESNTLGNVDLWNRLSPLTDEQKNRLCINGTGQLDVVYWINKRNKTWAFSSNVVVPQTIVCPSTLCSEKDLEKAREEGKQICIQTPSVCGLYSQSALNEAKQAAEQACRDDPASCGITNGGACTEQQLNAAYQDGYNDGIKTCGQGNYPSPTYRFDSSKNTGVLNLPTIDIQLMNPLFPVWSTQFDAFSAILELVPGTGYFRIIDAQAKQPSEAK